MEIFDSESLTPPGSPVLGYSGLRSTDFRNSKSSISGSVPVYCFNCKGPIRAQDKSFSSDSLFLRSEVITFIKRSGTSISKDQQELRLMTFFGFKFDPTETTQLKILIRMCRKNLYTLENLASSAFCFGLMGSGGGRNVHDEDEALKLRLDLCSFFNYIVNRRDLIILSEAQDLFLDLLKAVQKSKDWPHSLQHHCGSKDGNTCTSSEYHLFHLQLELRWFFMITFEFNQLALNWVLDDLLYLAYVKYKSGDENILERTPFNCYCTKELWAMIYAIVQELKPNEKDFWDVVTSALTRLDFDSEFIFSLWLFSTLVTLCDYEMNGAHAPVNNFSHGNSSATLKSFSSCYTLVNQVLNEWAKRGGKVFEVNELVFRLLPYWGFDLEVILLLWNFWLSKIDKGFEARNVEPYSSSSKWLQLISQVANSSESFDSPQFLMRGNGENDVFLAFLKLLCAHVKVVTIKDWRKLKSNICNRLSHKTVASYSENGFTRVATLFLALALVTDDTESMCERLNETLSYGKDSLEILKIRARFVMMLVLLQKSKNLPNISSQVMRTVNEIMGMNISGRTSVHKEIIMTYLDFITNIPKFGQDQNLGQSDLICLNLTMWLSTCGPNYANRTLSVLHGIMDSWILDPNGLPSTEKEIIGRIIQERTEQFLKQAVISSQNRNPEFDVHPMADLAVDLTILQSLKQNSASVCALFDTFALNPNTCRTISEIYVEKIMNSTVLDTYSINDTKLTQSWIRLMSLGCSVPHKLTARIFGISYESLLGSPNDHESLLKRFCVFANEPGNSWTNEMLQTLLSPTIDVLRAAKTKSFGNDGIVTDKAIHTAIILLENLNFASIYIRSSQNSFLPQVLEVCCPNFVGKPPWEKLPDMLVATLKKYLSHIFVTLCSNGQWLQDPYLKRKMTDLVRFSILGYVTAEELAETNPGLRIMQYCEKMSEPNRDEVLQEIGASLYNLSKDEQISKRFLFFVAGLLNRRMILSAVHFLSSVLDMLVEKVEFSLRCRNIVSATWASILGRDCYAPLRRILQETLEAAMTKRFAFRSDRFFELFSTLATSPQQRVPTRAFLSEKVLPIINYHISLSEMKQGSGANYKLRASQKKLEKELEM